MSQAWREFDLAIHALAGPGTRHARLRSACSSTLVNLRKRELPAESQSDFELFTRTLGIGAAGADSADLDRTIAAMSDAEVGKLIAAIIRMHDAVTRYQPIPKPAK